jgi:transposase
MARKWLWVGLDVGADEMTVCVTDDEGATLIERSIESKAPALHELLRATKRRIRLIGLESGSFGVMLSRNLRKLGYPVAMFEARQASMFLAIRRNKTDKNDARGIADIARLGRDSVSEVMVKSPECQRLRSTLVTRQKLVQLRIMLEAMMRSLFRLNGGRLKSCSSAASLKRNVSEELRRLRRSDKIDLSEDVEPLLALSAAARAYLEVLDKRLSEMASNDPICRRFLEIPGVGPITALCFYSAIQDPLRFRRTADIGAYLGLVPMLRQSGQNVSRHRISKMGDPMARAYLTTAAQHHLKHANSALSNWGAALSDRLRKGGVHLAVARKLAITMLAIWKSGQCYDPHHGAVTSGGVAA